MKIKNSVVTFANYKNPYHHIANCARICYASVGTVDCRKFAERLWNNGHRSMFRHASQYYIIPRKLDIDYRAYLGATVKLVCDKYYVSANLQSAREYWDADYKDCRISSEEAESNNVFIDNKMLRYTFIIETGIDITRELNRKSPNSISEQSTRYVDFTKKIGIVFKKCHWMEDINIYKKCLVKLMCKTAEWFYRISRSKYGLNLKPEDARWILPLDVESKVAYTYTIKEWEDILNLRLFDITGKAHPDVKPIMEDIAAYISVLGYVININKENYETKHLV